MNKNVYFYSLPYVDPSYQNLFNFKSISNQNNYFSSKVVWVGQYNIKVEPSRVSLVVDKPYGWFMENNINYISAYDTNMKNIYYFIDDFVYKTENSTLLVISVDVFQTYQFDFEILESFVDRCHVNRWDGDNPTNEYEMEDISYGENIMLEYEKIADMGRGVVVTSTVPLGKVETNVGGGSDGTGSASGDIANGIISANGLLFVKQEEGFAEYGAYFNGESFKTGGYGVTENYQTKYYRQLEPFPVSEEKASQVTYDLLNNEFGIPVKNAMLKANINLSDIPIYQFDVWVSIAFNYGMGGLSGLNAWQMFLANPKDTKNIATAIKNLKANPNRRQREGALFESGVYPQRQILKYGQNGQIVGYTDGNGWLPSGKKDGKYVDNDAGTNWLIPTTGQISAYYPTYPSGNPHNGVDIATPTGTPVYASKDGTVIKRRELTTSYGKFLIIQHDESQVVYAHNSELKVNEGDTVKQGQLIALSGNTGNSSGDHLHWEIRNEKGTVVANGVKTVNPMPNYKVGDKV